jgi:adenylylsulfate kinase
MSSKVFRHHGRVTRGDRERLNGHRGMAVWFTGLPASGKSTIAHAVEQELFERGCHAYVLDGDNVRHGLCVDLGFSIDDRIENVRRVGELAKLFVDAGLIILSALISPLKADRAWVRALFPPEAFLEVYCRCPLEVCESRDIKGLYQRARRGEVREFTGISSPYEPPEAPELALDTNDLTVGQSVDAVIRLLLRRNLIS